MMLNMELKVFCRVILECIKTALDEKLREEQAGVSSWSELYGPNSDTEQSIEWQSSLYINFIDLEKAFGSISTKSLEVVVALWDTCQDSYLHQSSL